MNQLNITKNLILETYAFAKTTYNDWTNFTCFLKHNEEYGELSEAILIEIGQIKHKELAEPVFGEIIDNLIMCIHYYSRFDCHQIHINNQLINLENLKVCSDHIYNEKNKLSLIQKYFKNYSIAKNSLIPLENRQFEADKSMEYLNDVFFQLVNLGMVFYSFKYPEVQKDILLEKTLEELNTHFSKKINKWKTIEQKR